MGPRSGMGTGVARKPGNAGGVKVPTVSRSRVGKHPLYPGERRRMARDLTRIGEKARVEPKTCFTSIYHLVKDRDLLRACYQQAEKGKAPGVDGVTKQEYGRNLESNLEDLSERLGRMAYRPKPVLRRYIRKPGSRKKRPLGLPSFEDKLVQKALTRVLEQIYEATFWTVATATDRIGRRIRLWRSWDGPSSAGRSAGSWMRTSEAFSTT